MTMTMGTIAARSQYNRDAILSATPVRLLTMLYDRLLLDLNRAEAAQHTEDWPTASTNLVHAQAIISELMSSLKVDAWEGGEGLFGLYTYVSNTLSARTCTAMSSGRARASPCSSRSGRPGMRQPGRCRCSRP